MAEAARMGLGRDGHEWVTGIAIEKLPEDIPAFERYPPSERTATDPASGSAAARCSA